MLGGAGAGWQRVAVAAVVLALGACAATPPPALVVLRSSPAAGAVLSASPSDVRVWFDRAPTVDGAQLLLDGAGDNVSVRMLHTMGEQDLMAFVIGELPDGRYRLLWRATGPAGAPAQGAIPFEVRRDDAAGATAR